MPSDNSSIIVCGQRYDVGRHVITYEDDPSISAYTLHCVSRPSMIYPYAPAKGLGTIAARFRERRLLGTDRSLPRLQQVLKQFVVHHDGMGTSRDTFRVLHDERGLSVHFLIDNNGDIYQTLDLVDCGFQAGGRERDLHRRRAVQPRRRAAVPRFLQGQARQGHLYHQQPSVPVLRLHPGPVRFLHRHRAHASAPVSRDAASLPARRDGRAAVDDARRRSARVRRLPRPFPCVGSEMGSRPVGFQEVHQPDSRSHLLSRLAASRKPRGAGGSRKGRGTGPQPLRQQREGRRRRLFPRRADGRDAALAQRRSPARREGQAD